MAVKVPKRAATKSAVLLVVALVLFTGIPMEQRSLDVLMQNNNTTFGQYKSQTTTTTSSQSANSTIPAATDFPEQDTATKALSTRERIDKYFDNLYASDGYTKDEIGWIQEYAIWHDKVLRQNRHNNSTLWTNSSIRIGIQYLYQSKGGMADRFKDVGHVLNKCHQERRLLFITWHHQAPKSLQEFLVPNLINWSIPSLPDSNKDPHNWSTPETLQLAFATLGDRVQFYQNGKPSMGNFWQPFQVVWHVLFQPSPKVQNLLDATLRSHNLQPHHYDAIHLRLAHPAFSNEGSYTTENFYLDKHGYSFFGNGTKSNNNNHNHNNHAIRGMNAASHAIECAQWLARTKKMATASNATQPYYPLYIYADSPDLIQTVLDPSSYYRHYSNNSTTTSMPTLALEEQAALSRLINITSTYPNRIAGTVQSHYVHLAIKGQEKHSDESLQAFYNAFVDLYMGTNARCLNMGVGRFAYLAHQISPERQDKDCIASHTNHLKVTQRVAAKWGMSAIQKEIPKCRV